MKLSYPIITSKITTRHYMFIMCFALLPILIAGVVNYGFYVLTILATSYIFSLIVELSFAKYRKKPLDSSVMVTPFIFALVLPPTLPLWIVAVGASFGTFFGKAIFGGMGKNIFNAAIVGRLFITISFPAYMATMWYDPKIDVITTATPLGTLNSGNDFNYSVMDLLLGQSGGSIGETFRIGIIIMGLLIVLLKIANWRIPVFYIGTVFVGTWLGGQIYPDIFENPILSLLVGGLLFGAFFVATDPVTSPFTNFGKIYYGIGLGIVTIVIRNFAAFPEGVMFSIILMNAIAPLLDDLVVTRKAKRIKERLGD